MSATVTTALHSLSNTTWSEASINWNNKPSQFNDSEINQLKQVLASAFEVVNLGTIHR